MNNVLRASDTQRDCPYSGYVATAVLLQLQIRNLQAGSVYRPDTAISNNPVL